MKKIITIAIMALVIVAVAPRIKITIEQPQAFACNMDTGDGC